MLLETANVNPDLSVPLDSPSDPALHWEFSLVKLQLAASSLVLAILVAGCGRLGFDAADSVTDDASVATDADPASDGESGITTYSALDDVSKWATFDTRTVDTAAAGFVGSTFDGRYLYLVPSYNGTLNGVVVRYDTQADFTATSAWSSFDLTTVNTNLRGFNGAAFDGRYVYLVPHEQALGVYGGLVARFDTQGAFASAASWTTFDTATVDADARGFFGATFDGRYLYLVPYSLTTVARFDTTASFTAAASWTTFDLDAVAPDIPAFTGGTFDGRYLYFAPLLDTMGGSGVVVRHDTQGAFGAAASWTTFATTSLAAPTAAFGNIAFDGRHIYFPPFIGSVSPRYDTQMAFTDGAAWSTFDTLAVHANAKNYLGGGFDGRYVYFAPYPGGMITRVDSQGDFGATAAWSAFDLTAVAGGARGFYGTTFDGRFLYLIAHSGSVVARFDAKAPPALPALPSFSGSFL